MTIDDTKILAMSKSSSPGGYEQPKKSGQWHFKASTLEYEPVQITPTPAPGMFGIFHDDDDEFYVEPITEIGVARVRELVDGVCRREYTMAVGYFLFGGEFLVCDEIPNFVGLVRHGANPETLRSKHKK